MNKRRKELALLVGRIARDRRAELGISQEAVARRMEVSRETVRSIEAGKSLPDLPTLERLAEALEMPIIELLGWSADVPDTRMSRKDQAPPEKVLAPAAA